MGRKCCSWIAGYHDPCWHDNMSLSETNSNIQAILAKDVDKRNEQRERKILSQILFMMDFFKFFYKTPRMEAVRLSKT